MKTAATATATPKPHALLVTEDVKKMSAKELKSLIAQAGLSCDHVFDKSGLEGLAHAALEKLRSENHGDAEGKPRSLNFGQDHPFTKLFMQALQKSRRGDSHEALQDFEKALEFVSKVGGPNCLEHAGVLNDMARVYAKLGQHGRAIEVASESLVVFERYWGKESQVCAETVYDIACYRALQKKPREALELMYRCRTSYLKNLGPEHPKTKQLLMAIQLIERNPKP
jgi:tetratricopeptide (TPR) repeat protein